MYGGRRRRTYSRTVISGGMVGICATSATRRARSRCDSERRSSPSNSIEPANDTSDAIVRSSVVLPAPFGPITATHSPGSTAADTPCSTSVPPSDTHNRSNATALIPRLRSQSAPARPEHDREERRAEERRHDPDRQLGRRDDRACEHVGEDEEPRSDQDRQRQQEAVAAARE